MKLPVLGMGGILGEVLMPSSKQRYDVRYRKDLNNETAFNKYLSERRAHCMDPYEYRYFDTILLNPGWVSLSLLAG